MHRVNVLLPGLSGTRKHSARSIILTMNMTHEVKQPNGSGLCARTFPCSATSSHVSSPCCLVMLTRLQWLLPHEAFDYWDHRRTCDQWSLRACDLRRSSEGIGWHTWFWGMMIRTAAILMWLVTDLDLKLMKIRHLPKMDWKIHIVAKFCLLMQLHTWSKTLHVLAFHFHSLF